MRLTLAWEDNLWFIITQITVINQIKLPSQKKKNQIKLPAIDLYLFRKNI